MNDALSALVQIVTLRLGPKHLPKSWAVVSLCMSGYAILAAVTLAVSGLSAERVVLGVIVDIGFVTLWCSFMLYLKQHTDRLPELLLCVFAGWLPLQALLLPVAFSLEDGAVSQGMGMLAFVVTLWSLTILGSALQQAMQIHRVAATLYTVGYFFLNVQTSFLLFGTNNAQ